MALLAIGMLMLGTSSCTAEKPLPQEPIGPALSAEETRPEMFPSMEVEYLPPVFKLVDFLRCLDYPSFQELFVGTQRIAFDAVFEGGDDAWVNYITGVQLVDLYILPDAMYREVKSQGTHPPQYEKEKGIIAKLDFQVSEEKFLLRKGINYELIQLALVDGNWRIERLGPVPWANVQDFYQVPLDALPAPAPSPASGN